MIDLGLCSSDEIAADQVKVKPRKVLAELLQKSLPADEPDYVLVRLEFVGSKNGETNVCVTTSSINTTKKQI
jgi:saccharopine dehydrogenase-like NADP-dependent oxidoreductase